MSRFLIEVPHKANTEACARAVRVFLDTGSYFLTHADWGCMDGVHKAWIIVDVEDKEQARAIVPPAYRSQAEITGLNQFTMQQLDEIMSHHSG
jgi:hypothetical protein